jgi:hypothetical protein
VRQPQRAALEGGRRRGDGTDVAGLGRFAEGCAGSIPCIDARPGSAACGEPTVAVCARSLADSSWP